VITSSAGALQIDVPREKIVPKSGKGTMEEMERSYITEVLNETYWRVNGPNGAAARLGMNPSTLRFRMKTLGISRPASFQG
jgi:formate hydrogenlyase transcriptional activator